MILRCEFKTVNFSTMSNLDSLLTRYQKNKNDFIWFLEIYKQIFH